MSMNERSKKYNKIIHETTDVYLQQNQQGTKNRYSVHYAPLRSRNNDDTVKTINRKSIEINTIKNATLQPQQRTYYKRGLNNMPKQSQNRRYEE